MAYISKRTNERVSIVDIAKAAKVSVATVSRAQTNPNSVSQKARQQIYEALQQLDCIAVRNGADYLDTFSKGLLIMTMLPENNPFLGEVKKGALQAAQDFEYFLLFTEDSLNKQNIDSFIKLIRKYKVQGVIIGNEVDLQLSKRISTLVPVIINDHVQDDEISGYDISIVTVKDEEAVYNAVNYLISLNRRKVAFLNRPSNNNYAENRLKGYRKALMKNGIEYRQDFVLAFSNLGIKTAIPEVESLLKSETRPDAIIASTDLLAVAAIKACNNVGLRVPEDIAIIGFDDTDFCKACSPSLSSIRMNGELYGYSMVKCLHEQLTNGQLKNRRIQLDTELIVRESTTL